MLAPLLAVFLAGPVHAEPAPNPRVAFGLSLALGCGSGHFYVGAPRLAVAFLAADVGYLAYLGVWSTQVRIRSSDPWPIAIPTLLWAMSRAGQVASATTIARNPAAWQSYVRHLNDEVPPGPSDNAYPTGPPRYRRPKEVRQTEPVDPTKVRQTEAENLVEALYSALRPKCVDELDRSKSVSATVELLASGWAPWLISASVRGPGLAEGCLAPTLQGLLTQEQR